MITECVNNLIMNEIKETFFEKGITGSTLKWIAMLTMLIDHYAVVFLTPLVTQSGVLSLSFSSCINSGNVYAINYIVDRLIGRIAFPLFCFLLVQGFIHTSSKLKYIIRLFLFALISEVPFDLAFKNEIFEVTYQNVFFTLGFGMLAMFVMDKARQIIMSRKDAETYLFIGIAVDGFVTLFFGLMAELMKTDYGMYGVFTICVMYYVWKCQGGYINKNANSRIINVVEITAGSVVCIISNLLEITTLITIPFIALYNGKRGMKLKFAFYFIYPVHLVVYYIIKYKIM